jgi:quinone-modifying oxidoreductase subunit QmoA
MVRGEYPDARIAIFAIDLRAPGMLDGFARKAIDEDDIEIVKGKVGSVVQEPAGPGLVVTVEDMLRGRKISRAFDLVVLAVGMEPQTGDLKIDAGLDEFGFAQGKPGIHATGCAKRPSNVAESIRDATGVALGAMRPEPGGVDHG